MECFNINIKNVIENRNFIYPLVGLMGVSMTYFGNRFIKATLFSLGTLLSMGSSYKLVNMIMESQNYHNCLINCSISIISGFSGGFLLLKLYKFINFLFGFISGGLFGYIIYDFILYNYSFGTIYLYDTIFWLSIFIPGLITGMVTYHKEKELSLAVTSFVGPALLIYSFNQFTNYNNLYLYIPLYLLMSSTGFYTQYKRYKNNVIQKNLEIQYSGKRQELINYEYSEKI